MAVREKLGFETFGKTTANRMRIMNVLRKRGHAEFEAEVLDSLMYLVQKRQTFDVNGCPSWQMSANYLESSRELQHVSKTSTILLKTEK